MAQSWKSFWGLSILGISLTHAALHRHIYAFVPYVQCMRSVPQVSTKIKNAPYHPNQP